MACKIFELLSDPSADCLITVATTAALVLLYVGSLAAILLDRVTLWQDLSDEKVPHLKAGVLGTHWPQLAWMVAAVLLAGISLNKGSSYWIVGGAIGLSLVSFILLPNRGISPRQPQASPTSLVKEEWKFLIGISVSFILLLIVLREHLHRVSLKEIWLEWVELPGPWDVLAGI